MKWFLTCLLFSSIFIKDVHANSKIRICSGEAVAYPWLTGGGKGLSVTHIHLVEKILNMEFQITHLPWKRCQLKAKAGQFDAILGATYTHERSQWGIFPESDFRMHSDSFVVFLRKDCSIKWEKKKFENVGKEQIGVLRGYSVGEDLKDAGHSVYSSFGSTFEILKALNDGVLKVAVVSNYSAIKTLNDHPELKKNIVRQEEIFKTTEHHLLFTKKFHSQNTDLVKKIWQAVAAVRKSPDYQKNEALYMKELTKNTDLTNL